MEKAAIVFILTPMYEETYIVPTFLACVVAPNHMFNIFFIKAVEGTLHLRFNVNFIQIVEGRSLAMEKSPKEVFDYGINRESPHSMLAFLNFLIIPKILV